MVGAPVDVPVVKTRAKKSADKTFEAFTWAKNETIPVDDDDRRAASHQLKKLRSIVHPWKPSHSNYELGHKYVAILSGKVNAAQAAAEYVVRIP